MYVTYNMTSNKKHVPCVVNHIYCRDNSATTLLINFQVIIISRSKQPRLKIHSREDTRVSLLFDTVISHYIASNRTAKEEEAIAKIWKRARRSQNMRDREVREYIEVEVFRAIAPKIVTIMFKNNFSDPIKRQ